MAKIVVLIALACLLVWLALDRSPQETKWRSLKAAFDRWDIGHLPEQPAAGLRETVAWLAPYAHVTGSIAINERPRAGSLNILTTKPAAFAVTGCARGNAIYDSTLDTVFIDEGIAWPRDIPRIGGDQAGVAFTSSIDLEFPAVFLRFVLAHELGHRCLHRGQAVFFDAANASRRMEDEADRFAIETLQAAYADDLKSQGRHIGRGSASSLQLVTADLPAAERVWADLVGTASSMSEALLFSPSDYSSFYEDQAHPTFLNRAAAIFSLALHSPDVGTRLKSHASYYLNSLKRTEQMQRLPISEWPTNSPVTGVSFNDNGVLALTNEGDLHACSLATAGASLGVHPVTNDRVIASRSSPQWAQAGVASGPQPSHFAIAGTATRAGGDYKILRDGSVIGAGKWSDVRAKIRSALKLPTAVLDLGTIAEGKAYLTVVEVQGEHEQIRGVASFDLAHNRLEPTVLLKFVDEDGGEAFSIPGDRIVVVPVEGRPRYFLVTRNVSHFLVFELYPNRPTHQVAIQPFMLNSPMGEDSTSDLLAAFDPHVSETRWIPPHSIVASFRGDSVFVIDVLSGAVKMVFNPGGKVRLAIGASGELAIFALNGYKVYVLNTAALPND